MKKQRTITLRVVKTVKAPEWAKYAATDADGAACVFSTKPDNTIARGIWVVQKQGDKFKNVGKETPPRDWRKTLRRIK